MKPVAPLGDPGNQAPAGPADTKARSGRRTARQAGSTGAANRHESQPSVVLVLVPADHAGQPMVLTVPASEASGIDLDDRVRVIIEA